MSEARDIAWNITRRSGVPDVASMDAAREWVKTQWPDWSDWIGHVMLDNIAECVYGASQTQRK